MVTFIAEYEDGSQVPFEIDRYTLRSGDHVARIIARENEEAGKLQPGKRDVLAG